MWTPGAINVSTVALVDTHAGDSSEMRKRVFARSRLSVPVLWLLWHGSYAERDGYDCLSVVVWNAAVHQPPTTLRTAERILGTFDTVSAVATDEQSWFKI